MSHPDFALAESVSTTNQSYFIAIYILILVYCCFGLAIVCDAYFVPALQRLSYTYDLPPDIAGSTLMALGASVPELFASLIGVFVTEDDIGTGSIIGSSCFNLIAVPAACAFVASATFSRKLIISPLPVLRNSAFYAITILVLLLIIKDNKVDIPEAIILLLFFVMYMGYMIMCARAGTAGGEANQQRRQQQQHQHQQQTARSLTNSLTSNDSAIAECHAKATAAQRTTSLFNLLAKFEEGKHKEAGQVAAAAQPLPLPPPQQQQQLHQQQVYGQYHFASANENGPTGGNYMSERTPLVATNKSCEVPVHFLTHDDYSFVSEPNLLDSVSVDLGIAIKNSSCLVKSVDAIKHELDFGHDESGWLSSQWVLLPMFPVTLCMKLLAPLKFKNTFWTLWTFIVSIALIGGLTYVSVWVVHCFGKSVGIPETVAGMTILSWGTGIPELIASIVLIKKTAQADMAICNTIGSNVIDASFCLSVPWIVKCIMNKSAGLEASVDIQSAALPWTSFTLFLSVVLLILILKFHNWELSCSVGLWLSATYVAFVVVATLLESSFSESGLDLLAMM